MARASSHHWLLSEPCMHFALWLHHVRVWLEREGQKGVCRTARLSAFARCMSQFGRVAWSRHGVAKPQDPLFCSSPALNSAPAANPADALQPLWRADTQPAKDHECARRLDRPTADSRTTQPLLWRLLG